MRLYGAINKVEPLDDGTVRVHGVASSEVVDDQSEVVRGAAIRAALPDYMRFPALREMHQLSAAGTTLEAEVGDDEITRIVAHVVDPIAVSKVKNQVYRGFSIGGRVTQREAGNPKTITGLVLNEISLVDRPANPAAVFDCWKASGMQTESPTATAAPFNPPIQIWACGDDSHRHVAKADALKCLEKQAAGGVVDTSVEAAPTIAEPTEAEKQAAAAEIEKRATEGAVSAQALIDAALKAIETGDAALAKSEPDDAVAKDNGDGGDMDEVAKDGDTEMTKDDMEMASDEGGKFADPGYQSDGKKRYKLNTEKQVRAAWSYIHMPKNAKFYSADQLSNIKSKIRAAGKKFNIDFSEKAAMTAFRKSLWDIGEAAELIGRLRAMCERLELERAMEGDDSMAPDSCEAACASACALLQVLCAEATQEVLDDTEIDQPIGLEMNEMMMSAIAQSLTKAIPDPAKVEQLMETLGKAGARHRAETQARLDGVAFATGKAMDVGDLKRAEMISVGDAHKAVLDAGAVTWGSAIMGREMLTDGNPSGDPGATQHATVDTGGNGQISVPNPTGAVPASPFPNKVAKTTDPGWVAEIEAMIKANKGGKALLRAAHDLLSDACDGATCKEDAAKPGHVSGRDMAAMHKCHGHLMAVDGVKCEAGGAPQPAGEAESQGADTTSKVAEAAPEAPAAALHLNEMVMPGPVADDLAKVLAAERAVNAELVKTMGAMVPIMERQNARVEQMAARVEQIANTPIPARAIANTAVLGLTKAQDGAPLGGGGAPRARPSFDEVLKSMPAEVLAAYQAQPADQQSMLMIKHSLGQPIAYDPVKRVLVAP